MSTYTLRSQREPSASGHDVLVDGYRVGQVQRRGERFVASVDESLFNGPALPGRAPAEIGDFSSLDEAAEQLSDYVHRPHLGGHEAEPAPLVAADGPALGL